MKSVDGKFECLRRLRGNFTWTWSRTHYIVQFQHYLTVTRLTVSPALWRPRMLSAVRFTRLPVCLDLTVCEKLGWVGAFFDHLKVRKWPTASELVRRTSGAQSYIPKRLVLTLLVLIIYKFSLRKLWNKNCHYHYCVCWWCELLNLIAICATVQFSSIVRYDNAYVRHSIYIAITYFS